jgi:hypothetical protein
MCSPRLAADRIIDYLEIAPKKCYFSVLNTFSKEESMMVAMRNHKKIEKILELWNNRTNENESFDEFRIRVHETCPELFAN